MEIQHEQEKIHQVLVKFLNGKHKAFNFTTPTITVETLKHKIQTLTSIPSKLQLLLLQSNQRPILLHQDEESLNLGNNGKFPMVVHLLLRLRGGKGGFGSLLRGAATKAGQKKTNNFDACRDMSGRRLRHVNAEKRLEEWRAEAEERKLEKMAEEFIKKKAKELKKGKGKGGGDAVDKYVDKYREDSTKCMEEVERSVRESMKGSVAASKRKNAEGNESHSKRFKIWMGKRALADSDSEDMDDDDSDVDEERENNKSLVTDNEDHSDSSKESDRTSDSVTDAKHGVISLDGVPSQSGSEEEKEMAAEESGKSDESTGDHAEGKSVGQPGLGVFEVKTSQEANTLSLEISTPEEGVSKKPDSSDVVERESQPSVVSSSGEEEASSANVDGSSTSKSAIQDEVVTTNVETLNSEMPLNFEDFNSASELEVLGLERLKSELQARGLKCGGTLQERAARLFLLKTTPLEKLPKKLLAKK